MKHLDLEMEKLEQRIAPDCISVGGITICDGSGDDGSEDSGDE